MSTNTEPKLHPQCLMRERLDEYLQRTGCVGEEKISDMTVNMDTTNYQCNSSVEQDTDLSDKLSSSVLFNKIQLEMLQWKKNYIHNYTKWIKKLLVKLDFNTHNQQHNNNDISRHKLIKAMHLLYNKLHDYEVYYFANEMNRMKTAMRFISKQIGEARIVQLIDELNKVKHNDILDMIVDENQIAKIRKSNTQSVTDCDVHV